MLMLGQIEVGNGIADSAYLLHAINMAEIINLRLKRKQKSRSAKESKAEQNRAKFGQTKAAKLKTDSLKQISDKNLDGHKLKD